MDKAGAGCDQPPPYPGGGSGPQPPPDQQYGQQDVMQNNTTVVVAQPTPTNTVIAQARPPDYLMPSILACLCCFWPAGLVAIYFAFESRRHADSGDVVKASVMSARAESMMTSSVVIGSVWIILVIVLAVMGVFQD